MRRSASKSRRQPSSDPSDTLRWLPVRGIKRGYILRSADQTVGQLRWMKLIGSLAEAEFKGQRWTFKRAGFLRPRVTVRQRSSDTDVAVLELSWGGSGLLRLRDGRRFRWERKGFWDRRCAFLSEDGTELVIFEPNFSILRRRSAVEIRSAAAKLPELGLLVTLGWYLVLLMADDDGAAVVILAS